MYSRRNAEEVSADNIAISGLNTSKMLSRKGYELYHKLEYLDEQDYVGRNEPEKLKDFNKLDTYRLIRDEKTRLNIDYRDFVEYAIEVREEDLYMDKSIVIDKTLYIISGNHLLELDAWKTELYTHNLNYTWDGLRAELWEYEKGIHFADLGISGFVAVLRTGYKIVIVNTKGTIRYRRLTDKERKLFLLTIQGSNDGNNMLEGMMNDAEYPGYKVYGRGLTSRYGYPSVVNAVYQEEDDEEI